MNCEYCAGTGKIEINEPAAYGYMPCDACEGSGGTCDECGRSLMAGRCQSCDAARAEGQVFADTFGMPF